MSAPAKRLFLASVHKCSISASQSLAVAVIWSVVMRSSDIARSRSVHGAEKESVSTGTQSSSLCVAMPEE